MSVNAVPDGFAAPGETASVRSGRTTRSWSGHGGLTVVGDDWGGAGRPVLLAHGGGQTRHSWDSTAETLAARGFRPVTMDLRGHGESAWASDGDYRLEAFAGDVLALCDDLASGGAGAPVVVGASLGGISSLIAVGEHAGTPPVSALVLVDVTPRLEVAGTERIRSFMEARPDGFASLDEAADAVAAYNPHRRRPSRLDGLAKNLRLRDDGRYYWHWDPRFLGEGLRDAGPGFADPDPADEVMLMERPAAAARQVRVPTLLVRGASSDVVSPDGAADLLRLIPHARHVDVTGAGHMVAGDQNDVFTSAVVDFLVETAGAVRP